MPPRQLNRLALAICARDEEELLAAHLLYHQAIGVERAYVFLDRCADDSERIASAFPWVTPIRLDPDEAACFPYIADLHTSCMYRALRLARDEGFEWLLVLDPDEFACADNPSTGGSLSAIGRAHLGPLLARVAPDTVQVRLATREVVPARLPEGSPFWSHRYYQAEPKLRWSIHDPLSGRDEPWDDFLGHRQGKPIIRTSAEVQLYDSHRWVPEQGVSFPHRPEYVSLPGQDLGFHWHFFAYSHRQWLAKFRKIVYEPETWACGSPVELPKQCWKRAASGLGDEDLAGYFEEQIARPPEELQRLAALGIVTEDGDIAAVLREAGCLEGDVLRVPGGQSGAAETFHPLTPRWPEPAAPQLDYPAARTPRSLLRGFHQLERAGSDLFRWAEPSAALKLLLPPGDYLLRLDMKHLWRLWRGEVRLSLNDSPLPPRRRRVRGGPVSQVLLARDFPTAQEHYLRLETAPIDMSAWSSPDPRRLGIPVFGVTFKPLTGWLSRAVALLL